MASALRDAGRGLVAGDFNPVLPEDQTLVADNGLVDAWAVEDEGSLNGDIWRASKGESHGPRRLDKVALTRLDVRSIDVVRPGLISASGATGRNQAANGSIPWSDHSGLRCTFSWPSERS